MEVKEKKPRGVGADPDTSKYAILKWNGKYKSDARFVILDQETGKQCCFTPGHSRDIVWVTWDLSNDPEIGKSWEDFEREPVDNLETLSM